MKAYYEMLRNRLASLSYDTTRKCHINFVLQLSEAHSFLPQIQFISSYLSDSIQAIGQQKQECALGDGDGSLSMN